MAQRILVVDDDREIVRLLRAYLEQAGYQVFSAYDGETALHIIRRERPDLVVLDLMLPDRDGWDVTRVVRGDPGLAATPPRRMIDWGPPFTSSLRSVPSSISLCSSARH